MSNITCPKPYTTSNEPGIPCGITYAEAIGYNNYTILRILAISFCFPLLIITIIQCIRLIYYRGIRPIVQIHGMYAFTLASVASQAIRSIDPQGWSLLLHPAANQTLGDISTCAILSAAFLVAMSWLKLMRRIAGKPPAKIYQHAEWIMPCGLFIITLILCILQTQVHNPGTYVFTMAKYSVFAIFIASFTITLWTQGIPLYIALNQSNGVSGSTIPSPKPDPSKLHVAASPYSPHKTLQGQPSNSALAIDAHLIRKAVPVSPISPHQVNIEMMDMESTTCGTGAGDDRSSFASTHSPQASIFSDHIQPVRTSIIAHQTSNPASAASSPSMAYGTRKLSTPSASHAPAHMLIPVTPTPAAAASASAPSSHSSVGKKKAKMTRILKLIVAASCVSLATVGFQISRIVSDYNSKFDDRYRPPPVPVGTFGSIFPNILFGIFEYLACIVILTFFRQMRGDGGNAYSDTTRKQSKQTHTHTYTQHTRTLEG